ncbi:MAG TPA: 30S ribosomal protein S6 [Candidatus Paceibacterota bacterium]
MVSAEESTVLEADIETAPLRVYEIGYHIIPAVAEGDVEKLVGGIREQIEKGGGTFIAEGAPALLKLSYPMDARVGDKTEEHDRAHFGWLKFEAAPEVAIALQESLRTNPSVLRAIVFRTVREETRARLKAPTIREVKRTEPLSTKPRRTEEESAEVSEADLDKALSDITTD